MHRFMFFSLFTIASLQLPHTTIAQDTTDELTGIKPTWVVSEMHVPAFFPAAGNMVSWSDGSLRQIPGQGGPFLVQELRKFDLEAGQKTVKRITTLTPNIAVPPQEFDPGDRGLSLASSVDGSVFLTCETRNGTKFTPASQRRRDTRHLTQFVLWDGTTLKPIDQKLYPDFFMPPFSPYPHLFSVSPNGKHAAVWAQIKLPGRFEYRICRFELSNRKIEPRDQGIPFSEDVRAIKVLNDGSVVLSCTEQQIRDDSGSKEIVRKRGYHLLTPGGTLKFLWTKERFNVRSQLAVSPDSQLIAVIEPNPNNREDILLIDVATQKPIGKVSSGPFEDPEFTFSPDGKYLAIGTYGSDRKSSHVLLYNLKTKQMEKRLDIAPLDTQRSGKPYRLYGDAGTLNFSPDGKWINWQRWETRTGGFYCVWSLE